MLNAELATYYIYVHQDGSLSVDEARLCVTGLRNLHTSYTSLWHVTSEVKAYFVHGSPSVTGLQKVDVVYLPWHVTYGIQTLYMGSRRRMDNIGERRA